MLIEPFPQEVHPPARRTAVEEPAEGAAKIGTHFLSIAFASCSSNPQTPLGDIFPGRRDTLV